MPSSEEHQNKAVHNKEFLEEVPFPERYADWTTVVCFYVAVHLADALLATDNWHPTDHKTRTYQLLRLYKRLPEFPQFRGAYRDLQDLAHGARYLTRTIQADDAMAARDCDLPAITKWIKQQLKRKGFLRPTLSSA